MQLVLFWRAIEELVQGIVANDSDKSLHLQRMTGSWATRKSDMGSLESMHCLQRPVQ